MLRQYTFGEQAVRWEACHRKTNLKMGHLEGQRVERRMSTSTALSTLQLSHNFTFRRSWGSSLVRACLAGCRRANARLRPARRFISEGAIVLAGFCARVVFLRS